MATFQAQVEGLTGLSIGSSPTTDELTQFLKDGVLDVTSRVLAIRPQDIDNFQRESATIDSNGGLDLGGAKIISVIREANADGSADNTTVWKPCKRISPALQSEVQDTSSLNFASIHSPVYIIDDNNKINVYPVASADNGYKVYYVNNIPTDETNEVALIHSHSDIKYFPNDKIYLVSIYASIKSLYNALSSHENPIVVPNFGDAENLISVEEDAEMLAGRIQTINAQIADYQAKVQESVVDYGWMEQRAKTLMQEYNSAFAVMAGPQPQRSK